MEATSIARILELTGMGENAAINRHCLEKQIAKERRRGSRGMRPVISKNWLK